MPDDERASGPRFLIVALSNDYIALRLWQKQGVVNGTYIVIWWINEQTSQRNGMS